MTHRKLRGDQMALRNSSGVIQCKRRSLWPGKARRTVLWPRRKEPHERGRAEGKARVRYGSGCEGDPAARRQLQGCCEAEAAAVAAMTAAGARRQNVQSGAAAGPPPAARNPLPSPWTPDAAGTRPPPPAPRAPAAPPAGTSACGVCFTPSTISGNPLCGNTASCIPQNRSVC